MNWKKYALFDQASGDGGDGGGAATTAQGGDTSAGTTSAASSSTAPTILATASETVISFPEKYLVKGEADAVDWKASALKQTEGYNALSKRLGEMGAPPKAPEEYKVTLPDALKDYDLEGDDSYKDFRAQAHKEGFTQKQFDLVMQNYLRLAPELVNGAKALSADEAVVELKKTWDTDQKYKEELGNAYRAAQAYGGDEANELISKYGNDPLIVRMLARIGKETKEDSLTNPSPSVNNGESVESLQMSEAYRNPKHPDHARVSAQVRQHFGSSAQATIL